MLEREVLLTFRVVSNAYCSNVSCETGSIRGERQKGRKYLEIYNFQIFSCPLEVCVLIYFAGRFHSRKIVKRLCRISFIDWGAIFENSHVDVTGGDEKERKRQRDHASFFSSYRSQIENVSPGGKRD